MKLMERLKTLMNGNRRFYAAGFLGGVVALALIGSTTFGVVHETTKTTFCVSCHEMKETKTELERSGHGMNRSGYEVACADCHITQGVMGMVEAKWKGLKEVTIHFADNPMKNKERWAARRMELKTKVAREMPQQNCTRCHDLDKMKYSTIEAETAHKTMTGDMRCLDCHSVQGLKYLIHNPVTESGPPPE
jgi:nitrate/TMAO reductase-like tetraheme cytochrome c subunit